MYYGCQALEYVDGKGYPFESPADVIDRVVNTEADVQIFLRPLSAITDEDAIEVFKMNGSPRNLEALELKRETSIYLRYRYMPEDTAYANKDGYCYSGNAIFFDRIKDRDIHQFLVQRGYAVPLFIAPGHPDNGKTAIELGLAIDATQTAPAAQNGEDE